MKEDLFTNLLPPEIIIDILSRLPVQTITSCKCVCRSWRNSVESLEFANSHQARSVSGLFSHQLTGVEVCRVSEFIDEVNPCCSKSFSLKLPNPIIIISSVVGLLFFRQLRGLMCLSICNPITREYIQLPNPPNCMPCSLGVFGFGVSRITRQYKIVCAEYYSIHVLLYIYTLGTGCWRCITPTDTAKFHTSTGVFLNGNLHWLARDGFNGRNSRVCCLNLETEQFSTFSLHSQQYVYAPECLTALGDRLCFLGCDSVAGEIVVWLMKEYGDEKSWTREFVIREQHLRYFSSIEVVRVCKNGDLLLALGCYGELACFSTKTNTIRTINLPGLVANYITRTVAYTPSFLPRLKSFVNENVRSF